MNETFIIVKKGSSVDSALTLHLYVMCVFSAETMKSFVKQPAIFVYTLENSLTEFVIELNSCLT